MSTDDKKDHPKEPNQSFASGFPIQEYKLIPFDEREYTDTEDGIDLVELAKTIWQNRKTIYRFVGIGFTIGILIGLLIPKEYVSSATLMPEYSTESQRGASSLLKQYGSLLGIGGDSYSSNSNAIRVDLYPKIVESLNFQDQLAREEFYFVDYDTTVSVYKYYMELKPQGIIYNIKTYTIGLPGEIINVLTNTNNSDRQSRNIDEDGIVELTTKEMAVIRDLRQRVTASLDDESGIVSVSAKMPNPKLAAKVTKHTIEELTNYLTEYRTEKVLRDLDFIEEQLAKSEIRFKEAKRARADFLDSNQGILTARARAEEQSLNSEYDLAFNLYNSLTQQYEEAKLKVQEETPVFKVLQPVQVPVKDELNLGKIILLTVLFSFFISLIFLVVKHNFFKINHVE